MEPELWKFLANLGVGGAIAGLLALFYRRDMHTFTDQWDRAAQRAEDQIETIAQIIRENTAAFTKAITTLEDLQDRVHRFEAKWDGQDRRGAERRRPPPHAP